MSDEPNVPYVGPEAEMHFPSKGRGSFSVRRHNPMTNPHAKAVEAAANWYQYEMSSSREDAAYFARAVVTAYLAAMRAEGWVMVPSVATVDMVTAAMSRPDYGASTTLFYGEIYRAMIESAMLKGAGDGQG